MASSISKWVILIAVDFYVDPDKRLNGCVNDVSDLDAWFRQLQHQHPIRITKLLAKNTGDPNQTDLHEPVTTWPTRNNVIRAVQDISEKAEAGDTVYFHYSGHGTLKPTTAAKYRDFQDSNGNDAALVLYDKENEVSYLRGIELAHLFDGLTQKQLKLTVVLDCCHAGGISRKELLAYVHVRGVLWDAEKAASSLVDQSPEICPPAPVQGPYRDGETHQHWLLHPERYVLIAGCGPWEIAGECRGEDGKIHGALSYLLLNILVSSSSERMAVTYASMYRQLRAKFHTRFPQQHPMLLGNTSATFLDIRVAGMSSRSPYSVVKASGPDQIWLGVGHAHGVCVDDTFAIHPMDHPSGEVIRNSASTCKIRIIAVHALQSQAKLIHSVPGASIAAGWFATMLSRSRLKTQVVLFNGANEEWKRAIDESMWLQVVQQNQATLTTSALQMRTAKPNILKILNASGQDLDNLPRICLDDSRAIQNALFLLEHLAKYSSIENLENWSGNSLATDAFSIECHAEDAGDPNSRESEINIKEGQKLLAIIRNNTDKALNVAVINLRPLREIKRVYPTRDRGEWKVIAPKGSQYGIINPGQVTFKIHMSFPDKIKAAGCSEITDTFKFFIMTRPSSFDALELVELTEKILEPNRRPNSATLANLLQDLAIGQQPNSVFRGDPRVSEEQWECCNFVVNTRRKDA